MNKFLRPTLMTIAVFGMFPLYQPVPPEEVVIQVTQVDSSSFPEVTVFLSATDQWGEPLGIDPDQLVIWENDLEIKPDLIEGVTEVEALTTLLVIDISGSMNEAGKLDAAKDAAKAFIQRMRAGDEVGILAFDTEVHAVQSITSDKARLNAAIDELYGVQDTAMYDALMEATSVLGGYSGRMAIICLTDGLDNQSSHTSVDVIDSIGGSGLSISTIGLGDPSRPAGSRAGLDIAALESLAAQAGGEYAYAENPEDLKQLYEQYARLLQSEYAVTYTSPNALHDGVKRQVSVSIREAQGSSSYNPGGLIPEVSRNPSWAGFLLGLGVLTLLVLIPRFFGAVFADFKFPTLPLPGIRRSKPKPRIRLLDKKIDFRS